jgi:hypothetical protein
MHALPPGFAPTVTRGEHLSKLKANYHALDDEVNTNA